MVAKLRDEYVAGRLSHDTFMHRVHLVLETRQRADLPPFVADLPAGRRSGGLVGWLRGTWCKMTGAVAPATAAGRETGPEPAPPAGSPLRAVTTRTSVSPAHREPFTLQFPRAAADRFTIGRDASCDLAIADMSVSRQHAQLERTPDGWLLSDLESTNGTRVNGWRVRGQVPVKVGDLVSFGNLEVIFARSDEPA